MRFPEPLRKGDTIAVFAGSSPFDRTLVWRGMGWLKEHYRVVFERSMFDRTGYLAGSDERREAELRRWMSDPDVKAMISARGGYGLHRFVHKLDWREFERSPKWMVGFSDVCALHAEAAKLGIASIHGPNVAGVGRSDQWSRDRMISALETPSGAVSFDDLEVWNSGRAEGRMFGGNLTLLHSGLVDGRSRIPAGSILLLEDVTERPYRVDRMLTTMLVGGHLDGVSGVLVGEWTDCQPGPDGVRIDDVLRERLSQLHVPVLARVPIGHDRFNAPVVLGSSWTLDGDAARAFHA